MVSVFNDIEKMKEFGDNRKILCKKCNGREAFSIEMCVADFVVVCNFEEIGLFVAMAMVVSAVVVCFAMAAVMDGNVQS